VPEVLQHEQEDTLMKPSSPKWPHIGVAGALFCLAAVLSACAGSGTDSASRALDTVLAGTQRSDANRARDVYRHPAETLGFFGVEPDMTVVELWPGAGGWYTEILAPYLRERGRLYVAQFSAASSNDYVRKALATFKDKLAAAPDIYDRVAVTELAPPEKVDIAPAGSADAVLTFRNVHNWMKMNGEQQVMQAAFRALKPGGVLGVVEHRARPGTPREKMVESGYVTQDEVIRMATGAGFVLEAQSEFNANPKDTTDHPKGVWTLPPSLALGDQDREKYLAIGESDRMTLRFRKPKR